MEKLAARTFAVKSSSISHWGQWVIARSEFIGFKRQDDFARAVGCQRGQIQRWAAMQNPPKQMRKGFDRSLARALRTSLKVLFTDYKTTPPDRADRIFLHKDHFSEGGLFPA